MARFAASASQPARQTRTTNDAGGDAYLQSPKLALASLALTSMVTGSAHRSAADELVKIHDLIASLKRTGDLKFAAQAALYARHTHGLRTISHVIAGEIALVKDDNEWRRSFFDKVVRRPDDAIEIAAYVLAKNPGKMLPNALKRGLGAALVRFDEYAISKYNKDTEGLTLIDLINLVHPKVDKKHAIHKLMTGKIKQAMTWENELSAAGQEEDAGAAKTEAWGKMFKEKQLGYMACLMNLRNICEQAPKYVSHACALLTDAEQVKKSLIMPTQFISAFKALEGIQAEGVQDCLRAINQAVEISMANVPKLKGRTLIALDASNSMDQLGTFKFSPFEIGALFAAVLYKANEKADFMYFSEQTEYMTFDRDQKLLALRENIVRKRIKGGTNFHIIFNDAKKAYDRIFILSDMQAWMDDNMQLAKAEEGTALPLKAYARYKKQWEADPTIFTFDLKNHGTSQFPTNKVCALAGWTDKVFSIMETLESDKQALVHEIEKVNV